MLYHSFAKMSNFRRSPSYNTANAGLLQLQCDRMEHTRKPLLPH